MLKTKPSLLPLICFCFFLSTCFTGCKKAHHCEYLVCKNGGQCQADTCSCAPGYFGALCENSVLGTYRGTLTLVTAGITDTIPNVTVLVSADTTSLTQVTLSSTNSTFNSTLGALKGTVSLGGELNIPSQTNTFGSLSATGSFYGNTLNFSFSEVTLFATIPGSFTGTRQ